MNINYPVNYCCSYRLGSGETVEDILLCRDLEAAFDKAKDDIKNKLWCESVFSLTLTRIIVSPSIISRDAAEFSRSVKIFLAQPNAAI